MKLIDAEEIERLLLAAWETEENQDTRDLLAAIVHMIVSIKLKSKRS